MAIPIKDQLAAEFSQVSDMWEQEVKPHLLAELSDDKAKTMLYHLRKLDALLTEFLDQHGKYLR